VRVLTVLISLVCVAVPVDALARPKPRIAVAPLKGDADGTVAEAVVDALAGKDFAVVTPDDVGREIKKLGLSNGLDAKAVRKLTDSLEVVAIVDGTVRKSARKRSVHLEVHRRGKPTTGFTVEFKTTASAAFHHGIHDQVVKRLGGAASRSGDDEDEDDGDKPAAKRGDNDDAGSLADADRKRMSSDDDSGDSKRKRSADDGASKRKLSADDNDSKRKSSDDDNDSRRKPSQAADDRNRSSSDDEIDRQRKPSNESNRKRGLSENSDRARKSDDDGGRKRTTSDDDNGRKLRSDDDGGRKRTASDDDSDRKRRSDDDGGRKRTASDDDSDRKRRFSEDEPAVRKRKTRRGDSYAPAQALARASAGASVAQRQLTYETRSDFMQAPPRVVTTAGGGRVDGELYPFALAGASGRLADLGLAASYDKTFGLSIKIPNRTVSAAIDQSHYAIGARYRFSIGQSSTVKLGLDYVRRHYIADRSSLMAVVLDAPDVDYSAIAPGIAAHVPVTPTITAVAGIDGMLMLETGPIQRTPSYGPATVYGIDALAGVDVALTPQIGLRVVLEYSRIALSFNGKGEMTTSRDNDVTTQDVNGATDRWIGVAATIGLIY
jgi:hypothetical protein